MGAPINSMEDNQVSIRFRTAAEFSRAIPREVPFVSEPYIVAGAIAEVSGKIKHGGKTTFMMAMARASSSVLAPSSTPGRICECRSYIGVLLQGSLKGWARTSRAATLRHRRPWGR